MTPSQEKREFFTTDSEDISEALVMDEMGFPRAWLEYMAELLSPDEWSAFLATFAESPAKGLLLNVNRIHNLTKPNCRRLKDFLEPLETVSWNEQGYYLPEGMRASATDWYEAGAFYLQDPSAMLPAQVLGAKPGEWILDLCAAPGGKAAGIANDMASQGVLVANEIDVKRCRALLHNCERLGLFNCVITNETPERLADIMPERFDRILVDAPCSGEGLFRRQPSAMVHWLEFGPEQCCQVQLKILQAAWRLLRPGGVLVYSTCTFSQLENEDVVEKFLTLNPDAVCEDAHLFLPSVTGVSTGIGTANADAMVRVWPHHGAGDGQFCARLRKAGNKVETVEQESVIQSLGASANAPMHPTRSFKKVDTEQKRRRKKHRSRIRQPKSHSSIISPPDAFRHFFQNCFTGSENLPSAKLYNEIISNDRLLVVRGEHLNGVRWDLIPYLNKLKWIKPGIYLGTLHEGQKKSNFRPSQALLRLFTAVDFLQYIDLTLAADHLQAYLSGNTLDLTEIKLVEQKGDLNAQEAESNWLPVCVNGLSLGWTQLGGRMLKNELPAGWRR
ncbi:MAG: methyltransferase RsmF C-terminal domain-like protein [Fastidiosipilaceae bacterium]|jgi:16S rRNA C967 or C1407 C5-methylase (RsmB/RsmF family)/NOL1/NOP2/fmu family ribosome biogenesis protein|nr:hypothetical protein [Clostridiaceae bacterium]